LAASCLSSLSGSATAIVITAPIIVVAAGVLAYSIHDLFEAGIATGGLFAVKAFDVSQQVPPGSWYCTLLRGTVSFRPDPSQAEVIAWATYLAVTMTLFFRNGQPSGHPTATPQPGQRQPVSAA
jgi:high-affinity iron transporter